MPDKGRISRSFSIGRMSEARFVRAAERLGLTVEKSTPNEDRNSLVVVNVFIEVCHCIVHHQSAHGENIP